MARANVKRRYNPRATLGRGASGFRLIAVERGRAIHHRDAPAPRHLLPQRRLVEPIMIASGIGEANQGLWKDHPSW